MKPAMSTILIFAVSLLVVSATRVNPVGKVLDLLSDMQAKITKEGQEAEKTYVELTAWCEDRSRNLGFEIKTAKGEVASLTAVIEKETSTIASLNAKVESP